MQARQVRLKFSSTRFAKFEDVHNRFDAIAGKQPCYGQAIAAIASLATKNKNRLSGFL